MEVPQGTWTAVWERSLFSQVFDVRKISLSWFKTRSDLCHNIFFSGRDFSPFHALPCVYLLSCQFLFWCWEDAWNRKSGWLKACGISSPWNLEKLTRKPWNGKGAEIYSENWFSCLVFLPTVVMSNIYSAFCQIPVIGGNSAGSGPWQLSLPFQSQPRTRKSGAIWYKLLKASDLICKMEWSSLPWMVAVTQLVPEKW